MSGLLTRLNNARAVQDAAAANAAALKRKQAQAGNHKQKIPERFSPGSLVTSKTDPFADIEEEPDSFLEMPSSEYESNFLNVLHLVGTFWGYSGTDIEMVKIDCEKKNDIISFTKMCMIEIITHNIPVPEQLYRSCMNEFKIALHLTKISQMTRHQRSVNSFSERVNAKNFENINSNIPSLPAKRMR